MAPGSGVGHRRSGSPSGASTLTTSAPPSAHRDFSMRLLETVQAPGEAANLIRQQLPLSLFRRQLLLQIVDPALVAVAGGLKLLHGVLKIAHGLLCLALLCLALGRRSGARLPRHG